MPPVELSPPGAPALAVWPSPAAELVRAVAVLVDEGALEFDVPVSRLDDLRTRLDAGLLDELRGLLPATRQWLPLVALVTELPAPGTVDALLALLDETPGLVWRHLAAERLEQAGDRDTAVAVRAGAATTAAARAALAACPEHLEDTAAPRVLAAAPAALGARVRDLLARVHDGPGGDMLGEAQGPMARETAARTAEHADGVPVPALVVAATNGYELDDAGIDRVLLLPSYWLRPWLAATTVGQTEVVTAPIPDHHVQLPPQAPPPGLVRLCKALGDDGRLRLLRRMAAGPLTLADAMDHLDVAKTTAHHHLSRLRQAGLVTVRGHGRTHHYELREDVASATARALAGYLGPVTTAHVPPAE